MAPPRTGSALAGLRAGALAGAVSVALTLGVMVAVLLAGGGSVQHDLVDARWVHHAVLAGEIGAGVGVVLGGLVGAILGRLGQAPVVAATVGGALALASATVVYLVRLHFAAQAAVPIAAGAAAAGAALGILAWLPFAIFHGFKGLVGR